LSANRAQWSTFTPIRIFAAQVKLAVNGAAQDRAIIQAHDIGLDLVRDADGNTGFRVLVGGGLGRTPILGEEVSSFVPWQQILNYCEAILRVYNLHGRRDNIYKARIKILVKSLGVAEFARQVEAEFAPMKDGPSTLTQAKIERVASRFSDPLLPELPVNEAGHMTHLAGNKPLLTGLNATCVRTRCKVTPMWFCPEEVRRRPGDVTADQFDAIADLADQYAFGEVRSTHEQNLVLASVRQADLFAVWQKARDLGLATPTSACLPI